MSAIAFNTKVETPEGPFTIKTVLTSPTAVMTRTDDGRVRFALTKPGEVAENQPVIKITLDDGGTLRVGPEQILFAKGMVEVAASAVKVGDRLESVFSFPAGYVYKTDAGDEIESDGAVGVSSVEPAGEADVYSLTVPLTGRFAFSSGVLGAA